ncbi:putative signal transducing protein [Tenacibaculum sp. nBUS_03]|uniref:putative signal transducing protein n=1 Tax=Tenacibaculum sp. nBUS_03 TaxID=3395320 RepID=UPI003EBAD14A
MKEHVSIFTGSAILVNRLAQLLNAIKIPSIIKNERESGRLAGFGTTGDAVELHIFNTDIEASKKIIENFKKEIQK